jgi:hypothetical protein
MTGFVNLPAELVRKLVVAAPALGACCRSLATTYVDPLDDAINNNWRVSTPPSFYETIPFVGGISYGVRRIHGGVRPRELFQVRVSCVSVTVTKICPRTGHKFRLFSCADTAKTDAYISRLTGGDMHQVVQSMLRVDVNMLADSEYSITFNRDPERQGSGCVVDSVQIDQEVTDDEYHALVDYISSARVWVAPHNICAITDRF